MVVYYDSD